jgi:glycosyltransferase involved in cell wall biosynthesis
MAARAVRAAAVRYAVSVPFARLLTQTLPPGAGHWECLPNMLDARFELPPEPRRRDGRDFVFLTLGTLHEKKGHVFLIDAFAARFRDDPRVHLRIAGDGPLRPSIEGRIAELGLGQRIRLLGQVDREQVARELGDCDAFVLPSLYETFGVALIEALACGRPVVATRCGGPEAIVSTDDGILVHSGDSEGLGAALARIRESAHGYDADAIRRRCLASYGASVIAARMVDAYAQVVNEAAAR